MARLLVRGGPGTGLCRPKRDLMAFLLVIIATNTTGTEVSFINLLTKALAQLRPLRGSAGEEVVGGLLARIRPARGAVRFWTASRGVERWDQNITPPRPCRSLPYRPAPRRE